ncbi:MAG: hypothetical protein KBC15_00895 [Candidatus Levybacteria bacterium]|nr:hypothetical protein [Candidatus Levybacteria bacterium]
MEAIFLIGSSRSHPNDLDALTASIKNREQSGVRILEVLRIVPEGGNKTEVICKVRASFNEVHALAREIQSDKKFKLLPIKILRVK